MQVYVQYRPEIRTAKHLKVLITGHSLGGACASALAARLDDYADHSTNEYPWFDNLDKGSIYVYTFGAIKTITQKENIETPYKNIHNIYNYYDDYGPNGSQAKTFVGSIYQKFGHTDLFKKNYNWDNHNIANYRDAIENDLLTFRCANEDPENDIAFVIDDKKGSVNIDFDESWFDGDSKEYNHELCQFTSKISMISYSTENNYSALSNALTACGFSDVEKDFDTSKNEVNYFIANKEVVLSDNKQYNLVFAGFIGTNKEQWMTDFAPGYNLDQSPRLIHEGFETAASYAYGKVSMYLSNHRYDKENTILLFTGHSRGAAVANIVAAWFIDYEPRIQRAPIEKIFTYTFATPKTTADSNKYSDDYLRIFNIVNPEDVVTKFMPERWGYGRYGRTFSLPTKTNCRAYSTFYNEMQHIYKKYTGNTFYGYDNGEETVNKLIQTMTSKIGSSYQYCNKKYKIGKLPYTFEEFIQTFVCPVMIDASEYNIKLLTSAYLNSEETIKNLVSSMIDVILDDGLKNVLRALFPSHEMQTYCAWVCYLSDNLSSQSSSFDYGVGTRWAEYGCYKGVANCPVDIEIYDSDTGLLLGRIKDNTVDMEVAAEENAVFMTVDGDSKSFWLPYDGNYEIKLIGNDNGTMDYTLIEIDSDKGEVSRVNFFDVPITKGKTWTGETQSEDFEIEAYTISSDEGKELKESEAISDTSKRFDITLTADGNGNTSGSLTAVSGDYVNVSATPEDGSAFAGWYENNKLISSDSEYSFVAKSDRNLVAKFTESSEKALKATFVADGVTVKVVEFNKGDKSIEEPAVPAKEGYTGKWSDYVLADADITINAIYTAIDNPTQPEKVPVVKITGGNGKVPVDYKATVIFHATVENGNADNIVWYKNGEPTKQKGSEYKEEKVTSSFKLEAKYVEGEKAAQSGEREVSVSTGFFAKIIAFFRGLFNKLPVYEDGTKKNK